MANENPLFLRVVVQTFPAIPDGNIFAFQRSNEKKTEITIQKICLKKILGKRWVCGGKRASMGNGRNGTHFERWNEIALLCLLWVALCNGGKVGCGMKLWAGALQ